MPMQLLRLFALVVCVLLASACGPKPPHMDKKIVPTRAVDPWPARPTVAPAGDTGFAKAVRLQASAGTAPSRPGVNLVIVERHDTSAVFLRWVIPGGRRVEFEGKNVTQWPEGTVDLMADMLTEGSRKHRGSKLAAALEGHGADLSVDVMADALVVTGRVLSHQLDAWLSLSREALLEPTFEARPLRNLLKRNKARLSTISTRPRSISTRVFNRLIHGPDHPYGSSGATIESISRIRTKHLKAARKALVKLGGSTLVVVGDVNPQQFADKLTAVFGRALRSVYLRQQPLRATQPVPSGCYVVDVPKSVQATIIHGNPAPRRGEPTWPTLILANQVLGGSASSRLFTELRERRGLTYGVYSSFDGRRNGGDWSVSTAVRTPKAVEALIALRGEFSRMQQTAPTVTEVTAARRYLIGQFIMAQASGGRIAQRLASLEIYDRPPDYWQRWTAALRAASPQQLSTVAKRWLSNTNAVTLLVGNLAAMRPALDVQCPRLVLYDARGRVVRHLIDHDAQMTATDRADLFARWATDTAARPALKRFLQNTKRLPMHRASALFARLSGPQDADGPGMGDVASDWPKVAQALVPMLTAEFDAPVSVKQSRRARAARRWLLDLASPASGDGVLSPSVRMTALKAVARWAFAGVAADGEPKDIKRWVPARLVEADLPRLGMPGVAGLEALVSTNVWRTSAAKALIAHGNLAAARALARGYRRAFVVHRAMPSQVDLDLLARAPNRSVAQLLFDVYTLHRLGHANPDEEPALGRISTTLRTMIDAMAARPSTEAADKHSGRTELERHFEALMSSFESLLTSPDPDDRWWSADHLVRYRGEKGLRIVLLNLADDTAYARSPLADIPATEAFTQFARTRVVPMGEATIRPLMLAALAGQRRVAKIIAITALRSMRDAASMSVLRTHTDRADVGAMLGVRQKLSVTQMARAAGAVRRYVQRVDTKERSGDLSAEAAAAHREEAYRMFTLQGRTLAETVSRAVRIRLRSP